MHTEEQAKVLHCCGTPALVSATLVASEHIDVAGDLSVFGKCIASQCMAWRWARTIDEHLIDAIKRYRSETGAGLHEAKDFVEAHPEYRTVQPPTRGYCGLASKP